jgi:hypothetical protein
METGPEPSLVNEKVREVASGSPVASSIMSLNVIEAVAALWVGLGDGVGFVEAEALGPALPELPDELPVGVAAEGELGVAVGPPAKAVPVSVGEGLLEFDPK